MRRHMLGWFKLWLRDEGHGWPCPEPDIPELPETDLMCFPGTSRPAEIASIVTYASARGREQRQALVQGRARLNAAGRRRALRSRLRLSSAADPVTVGPLVEETVDHLRCQRFAVSSAPGVLLPCIRLASPASRSAATTVIAVHADGKSSLASDPRVRSRLDSGQTVCLVDLRGTGETAWDTSRICRHHDAARAALWLGHTLVGDWVQDLLAVRTALCQAFGARQTEILAVGDPAMAALAAAALGPEFAAVHLTGVLASYVLDDAPPAHGMGLLLPGILRWGDVSLLLALAQCPVTVEAPVTASGRKLDAAATQAWAAEVRALARRLGRQVRLTVRV